MKRLFLPFFIATYLSVLPANADHPFRGTFIEKDLGIRLVIDLYEESIDVPDMEMFGPLNGYACGSGLYRIWYVSKVVSCEEQNAVIHLSNDLGSETQTIELTLQGDTALHFRQKGGGVMKKAVGKKLVKIQSEMTMKRQL